MNKNKKDIEIILKDLLVGMYLTEFGFHTSFVLKFSRNDTNDVHSVKELSLQILSDWWFNSKCEWDTRVKNMTLGETLVEPEEPVLAYDLARLRWSEGTQIESVEFSRSKLLLYFKNGEYISILNNSEEDYDWTLNETNFDEKEKPYSIICEAGTLHM